MISPVDTARSFWQNVLQGGGSTAIPRWTLHPVGGTGQNEVQIPAGLGEALQELADELMVPVRCVWLAAHVRVIAALAGDVDIVTGYLPPGGTDPLPCRVSGDSPSWRALIRSAEQAESQLLAHRDHPVEQLRQELGLTEPTYEIVFDPSGSVEDLPDQAVLGVQFLTRGSSHTLRLRYRTEVLDEHAAARIAGYHLTALTQLTSDPGADPAGQSLLAPEERELQLEGMAGPRRELPDRRFHELFETRVQDHPDATAAEHRGRQWTYRELNARANRLSRALLKRGLQPQGVVAVVTERNLDWMAAVLAIFKAGGVYLPIEPHFPSERIATALSRSGCRLVLTEGGSTATLDPALEFLPQVEPLFVDAAYAEIQDEADLGITVTADQPAYIYFTSGSTGAPKGAMCEHGGMLNHLLAKVEDLEIGEGQVVAQVAPQCFDISLWQLVSALLVGGKTLLIEQDVVLDVPRFVDKIVEGRVSVAQLVPSYLEAVLAFLEEQPRELPDLHTVSVTGEALKKELAQRWFAALPAKRLVNAYGLTETSDDTNHEVMTSVPVRDRVPLGPPIRNVHVYVVDENLLPVPLGAPGEIAFSGICVGRGYVNDPERTRAAFMPDPLRPGQRLYRSGDFGRWLPEGKLEFLGRRDTQVKISGFRIEIGEVENALLRIDGVRDGAVVVAGESDRNKRLVGFYTGSKPLESTWLRAALSETLPSYMVPSVLRWQETLPLTPNSKIDRKKLTAVAAKLERESDDRQPPVGPTEQRVAVAWAKVLGVPVEKVGRLDHFFDRGGTSLAAVKLAIALERAVSLKDLTRHPVLCDLARLLDGRSERRSGLLQALTGPASRSLVCVPYAGGNAVNFQPLAGELRGSGVAVYAVELPGHDVAADREPFASLSSVVETLVEEIVTKGLDDVLLWGHSSGTAVAVETALQLQRRGVRVSRLFLAAQLPGTASGRRAVVAEVVAQHPSAIATRLGADGGYTALGELDAQRAEHVGAAYQHDVVCASTYLTDLIEHPPSVKLNAPVTVVVSRDDPSTADAERRYRDWLLVADDVELLELDSGGHYFLRTRPAETARAVLSSSELLTSSPS